MDNNTKLLYAQSLPGYGTGGADGSAGLLGFSVYFTSYSGDTDGTDIKDLIDLNKPLLGGSHFPGGYPNRHYQTGDVFVDLAGKVWEIDLSLLSRYHYAGYNLSSKSLFVLSNTGIDPQERWTNQYPFNIVDTVNANTLTSSYYTDFPDVIYGIDSKKFARIEYSNKVESGNRNVFSLFIGADADSSDNYAIGLIRDIASNSFRLGNIDEFGNIRAVNLEFDVKSLKANKINNEFTKDALDGTLLTNSEFDTKNLINPYFDPSPSTFRYDSPLSTYTNIYWDLRDFLKTSDPAILGSISSTLHFQQNPIGGILNFIDTTKFRELTFPKLDVSGNLKVTGLPSGYRFKAFIIFEDKGWRRSSNVMDIHPGIDPVHLILHNPEPVCSPSTVDLTSPLVTAGSTPSGIVFSYWNDAGATSPVSNPAAVTAGNYYISATDGISRDPLTGANLVIATVNVVTPGLSVAPGNIFCAGTSVTFTATGGLNYNFRVNGSSVQNGASSTYTTTTLTNGQIVDVVVTATFPSGPCSATSSGITVLVNVSPTVVITNPAAVCSPGTCDLTAPAVTAGSTGGIILTYWNDAGATSPVVTPTAVGTGTYYIKGVAPGGCFQIQPVTVNVKALPTISGVTSASRCGSGIVSLTATASTGATIYWWDAPSGGTNVQTGPTYNPTISSTTTYYVDCVYDGCTSAARTAVTGTVNTIPTITGVTPDTRCGTGSVTLGASASAGTIHWYDSLSGGSLVGTGTSFSPSISSTTTYYVETTSPEGCTSSPRTSVTATVNTIPTLNITNPASVELPATVDLTAAAVTSGSTPGLTLTYWNDAGLSSPVSTPAAVNAGTYYIKGTVPATGCFTSGAVVASQYSIPVIGFRDDGSIDLSALGSKVVTITFLLTASAGIQLGYAGNGYAQASIEVDKDGLQMYPYSQVSIYAPSGGMNWANGSDPETLILTGIISSTDLRLSYDANSCEMDQDADIWSSVQATITDVTVTSGGGTVNIDFEGYTAQYESGCAYFHAYKW